MVYCNCKTNHKRNLACSYYIHCSVNSKKNFLNPKKVKNAVRGLFTRCLPLLFHSPLQGRQTYCEHLKSCLDITDIRKKRYYTFMASPKIPWHRLWPRVWKMIPQPESNGRLLVALDDFINPKTGKKIFGCANVFDHAAKQNQSKYPWAQNIVSIGDLVWQQWSLVQVRSWG